MQLRPLFFFLPTNTHTTTRFPWNLVQLDKICLWDIPPKLFSNQSNEKLQAQLDIIRWFDQTLCTFHTKLVCKGRSGFNVFSISPFQVIANSSGVVGGGVDQTGNTQKSNCPSSKLVVGKYYLTIWNMKKEMGNRPMKKKATVTYKAGLKQIFLVEFPPIHSFHGPTNTCNIERLKKISNATVLLLLSPCQAIFSYYKS